MDTIGLRINTKTDASLGLCQPQRNNHDIDIKSEFSKGGEREAKREKKPPETMTSLTIEVLSLTEKKKVF